MEKYFEINKNGQKIKCKIYYNESAPIEKVILFGHGFAGHKDNNAAHKFADKILHEYSGIAVLIFNLPGHGDDFKKVIVLNDCMTYIGTVVDYIKAEFHTAQLYSYATSFGGYLILNYIAQFGNPFIKIALRCPAVNMADVLTKVIIKEDELADVLKGRLVQVGFDRKIEVDQQFLKDLEESDIRKYNYLDSAENILILHGTKDEVASFEESQIFAQNYGIEFIPVENADHRFQNPVCMNYATKKVLEFFNFE